MAERFLSARPHGPKPQPPFPLVSSASFGPARSSPGREAAKRTLDGEDRSDTMKREGKGGYSELSGLTGKPNSSRSRSRSKKLSSSFMRRALRSESA